jgi:uncharacterized protein (TIGR00730 family)
VSASTPRLGRLCVFCGSRGGTRPSYLRDARALGQTLAERGIGLVYGGAHVGLMGAVADAAMAHGGEVIGVIPQALVAREVAHRGLTELHVVDTMHQRKAKMAELSDGFVALPGGLGTLEELFEVVTWAMLAIHRKPIGVLDTDGYWGSLFTFLTRAANEGFVDAAHLALILRDDTPRGLNDRLQAHAPEGGPGAMTLEQT